MPGGKIGEVGKAITEILEGEFQLAGQADRVGHGFRVIAKQGLHVGRGMQVAVLIDRKQAAGGIERRVVPQAGKDVRHDALGLLRVERAAGGQQRQPLARREGGEHFHDGFLAADAMPLDFHMEAVGAEDGLEWSQGRRHGLGAAALPGPAQRTVLVAGHGDEAASMRGEFIPRGEAAALALARVLRRS